MAAPRRLNTRNLLTIVSVAILVGTDVLGTALAAGWAVAGLFQLGDVVGYALMALFTALGLALLVAFMRSALRVEPIRE